MRDSPILSGDHDIKKAGRGPRSRMCYICGRQTLLAGFDHHVEQCKNLFEQREALKPVRERRRAPEDPMLSAGHGADLGRINELSQQAYNQSLSECQFCGRRFLPEKLLIHNRSCRSDNPARRVDGSVNRRNPSMDKSTPLRPTQPQVQSDKLYASSPSSARSSLSTSSRPSSRGMTSANSVPTDTIGRGDNGYSAMAPPEDFVPAMMRQCPDCGRSFNEMAYERHVRVCKKVFIEKRKPYDSAVHRSRGSDLEEAQRLRKRGGGMARGNSSRGGMGGRIPTVQYEGGRGGGRTAAAPSGGGGRAGSEPKWKANSDALRQAMKAARQVSLAQKKSQETGIPLHQLLPAPSAQGAAEDPVYATYVQCPTCGRKFNEIAGARHIPKCKDIINKPSRLKAHSGHVATTSQRNF